MWPWPGPTQGLVTGCYFPVFSRRGTGRTGDRQSAVGTETKRSFHPEASMCARHALVTRSTHTCGSVDHRLWATPGSSSNPPCGIKVASCRAVMTHSPMTWALSIASVVPQYLSRALCTCRRPYRSHRTLMMLFCLTFRSQAIIGVRGGPAAVGPVVVVLEGEETLPVDSRS
jgi:hypothetical protein